MRSRIPFLAFAALFLIALAVPVPAKACYDCDINLAGREICRLVFDGETGQLNCVIQSNQCSLSGTFCSIINVGGGGGGGTTGGGGGCTTTNGSCPAECFSCTGGGGRPRI